MRAPPERGRQRLRRITRSAVTALSMVLLATSGWLGTTAHAAPASPHLVGGTPTTPLPLYAFAKTSSGPLPWDPSSLATAVNGATITQGPLATSSATGEDVIAFATATSSIGVLSVPPASPVSSGTYVDLSSVVADLPAPGDAPVPFVDALGDINVVYVGVGGDLYLVTNAPVSGPPQLSRGAVFTNTAWRLLDLSNAVSTLSPTSGVLSVLGEPAVTVTHTSDQIAVRTSSSHLVVLTLGLTRPFLLTVPGDVSTMVSATSPALIAGSPVSLGVIGSTVRWAAVTPSGHVEMFQVGSSVTLSDLSSATSTPNVSPSLAAVATASYVGLAAIASATGDVIVLSTTQPATPVWSGTDATSAASSSHVDPPLTGTITIARAGSTLLIAGQSANWGDLFAFTSSGGTSWSATDVSATGGSFAKTVGPTVSSVTLNGALILLAGGVATPAPQGVGIYDVPTSDLPHAVSDGWRILADTGGLGTTSTPYTNVWPTTPVNQTPDFLTGQRIATATNHPRTTWLSFWTVSGPGGTESVTPATFEAHAYAAGAAVATEIDAYRNAGLGLKPDWVILDPEGFPDNHSELDGINLASVSATPTTVTVNIGAPTNLATGDVVSLQFVLSKSPWLNFSDAKATITVTSKPGSPTTFTFPYGSKNSFASVAASGKVVNTAKISANWAATIAGWRAGLAAVDPSLNAAIYTEESQYSSFGIAQQNIPVFMAIAYETSATPYAFTVTATNSAGSSSAGVVTTQNVATTSTAPGAPTNVKVLVTSNTTATVSWSPPVSSGSSPVTGYTVRAYRNGSTLSTTCHVTAPATSCALSGLTNLIGSVLSPSSITHTNNVLGYIEFGNLCTPGLVKSQMSMLTSSPFNGLYNTVQFTPPGYCTPTTP